MKISKNLLKNFIDIPDDIDKLTNQYITEVESYQIPFNINDLVIGHVLECENHPNSDHLHITKVDVKDEVLDIVCGAPNVEKGQYVIVAKEGARLGNDFVIKKSTIRGVESNGMITSLKELGFDEKYIPLKYANGIYHFADNMQEYLGCNALEVLNIDGFVLELGLTPNRSDLLSYLGYAYDLSAVTDSRVHLPKINIVETGEKNPISLEIQTNDCKLYYARHFTNITIKESPWWLKSALILNDIRPVNNVVDITNYVLLEYGTPLHTFDAKKVKTNTIIVRNGHLGEEVITLDEQKRTLTKDDIVITNGSEPIALGGVMGLLNTSIDDNTTEVILEAACFDKLRVRETSKRLNLKSDSSLRFEKGVDIERVILGLERATMLLIELADAKVSKGILEARMEKHNKTRINVSKKYISKHLGTNINEEALLDIFRRLNYKVAITASDYSLTIPSYRSDVLIPADILEEVGRIYGYDNLKSKPLASSSRGSLSIKQKNIRKLRHLLANNGLSEIISYTLLKEKEVTRFCHMGDVIKILKPLTEDRKAVRQSLVNGLIETLNYNQSRKVRDCNIFEIGNCYANDKEVLKLGILLSGTYLSRRLDNISVDGSFYLLKGLLDKLAYEFNVKITLDKVSDLKVLHPNKQADIMVMGQKIGFIGELHPQELKYYDIEEAVVLEIELPLFFDNIQSISYKPVTRFPSIERDIAFIVSEEADIKQIEAMLRQTAKKYLTKLEIFDVYRDEKLGDNKKSLAYALTFNDTTKTLESNDVDKLMKSIINRLEHEFKAQVRVF